MGESGSGVRQGAPPARSRGGRGEEHAQPAACPSGHRVSEGARYCTECGLRVGGTPAPWTCAQGHESEAAHRYCGQCGAARPEPEAQSLIPALVSPPRYRKPGPEPPAGAVHIHFVEDGFGALGTVWYRGQELQVLPGTSRYEEARPWIHLDAGGQQERFGKVYFAPGPMPETAAAGTAPRRVPGA